MLRDGLLGDLNSLGGGLRASGFRLPLSYRNRTQSSNDALSNMPMYAHRCDCYFASAATGFATSCFFFQSPIAARIASSASTEQWIFTGGSESSFTMSVFLIARASSTVLPFTHSVASEEEAMAEPQPKVLNLASSMTLVSRIDLDLQLHDVAALGRADQARANFGAALVQRADVARIVVVIDNFVAICHCVSPELRILPQRLSMFDASGTTETVPFAISLLSCPLHILQVDAFLRHLVQRRKLAQALHHFDHAVRT